MSYQLDGRMDSNRYNCNSNVCLHDGFPFLLLKQVEVLVSVNQYYFVDYTPRIFVLF